MTSSTGRGERDRLVSLREAARMLGVHHATLARAVKRGDLKAAMTTPGGWKRFRSSDVELLARGGGRARIVRSSMDGPGRRRDARSDVERALATLPEIARSVIGADFAAITVLDNEDRVIQMYYSGISEEQASQIGDPPRGIGVLGQLGQGGGVLRLDRISDHPRSSGFPPNHPPMDSLLGISVSADGGLKANLYLANGPGKGGFTDDDEARLVALATFGRLGLQNTRLLEDEARLRREAEAAQRHLAEVIRGSSAGVVVFNAKDKTTTFASAEARRITGHSLPEGTARAKYLADVHYYLPDGTPISPDSMPLEQVVASGERIGPVELVVERTDGRRVPVLVSAAPVHDTSGAFVSVVLVFQDTTRLKELDAVKNEFLSMITHDLRSPIATIKGVSTLALNMAPEDSELRFHLEEMDDEVDHVTELVGNLLDMTRIEAGTRRDEYETAHMADIVQDAVSRLNRSRQAEGRQVDVDVSANLPSVYVDPLQVGRVLDNLLSNALKYSDGRIHVTADVDTTANELCVSVSDQGDGIPSNLVGDIFDKFMRVRQGLRRGREGAGLGLAICKAIVESHGGRIGVESVEREGSRFWFTLPLEAQAATTTA